MSFETDEQELREAVQRGDADFVVSAFKYTRDLAYERAAMAVSDARGQNRDGTPDYDTLIADIRALKRA